MAKTAPEINAGSMADIAFLLLIFFLVTTTMDVDTGITRRLPPPINKEDKNVDVKERNVLKILINSHDQLLVDGKPGSIATLANKVKDFMAIHPDDPKYPETSEKYIAALGKDVLMSKGVVSLKNDRGTSYEMYIKVQNELARAFNEMKNDMSVKYYGVRYDQLMDAKKIKAINALVPIRVSEAEPENVGGQ